MVVFGASGSLATKRLGPAIEKLASDKGRARRIFAIGVDLKPATWALGKGRYAHIQADLTLGETYHALSSTMRARLAQQRSDCTYYLATAPQLFPQIVEGLENSGLDRAGTTRRILVEKPFGTSLGASRELQKQLDHAFGGARVYRVDHFLAKVGFGEIVGTRHASAELEEALNRNCVDHVQLMADEDLGVEGRASFYDRVGVMRDMVQSHMLQVLCQVAMDLPRSPSAERLDEARANLLKRVEPIQSDDVVWGQYSGYRSTHGVGIGSRTPTFVALRLSVKNERWRGVPFYLRSGKRLRRNVTKAVIVFKKSLNLTVGRRRHRLGYLSFEIDPAPALAGGVSPPGGDEEASATSMVPIWRKAPQDEYELLLDSALEDDHSHFVGERFNELAWRLVDPPIKALEEGRSGLRGYVAGTDGPADSGRLLASSGRAWA